MSQEELRRPVDGAGVPLSANSALVLDKAPQGRQTLVEGGVAGILLPAAVPSAVGPLPLHKGVCHRRHPRLPGHPQAAEDRQGVALLGPVGPGQPADLPDSAAVRVAAQPVQDLVGCGHGAGTAAVDAQLHEGDEPPVGASPLLVWAHSESAVGLLPCQQCFHTRPLRQPLSSLPDLVETQWLIQQVDHHEVAYRRVVRSQQPPDRGVLSHSPLSPSSNRVSTVSGPSYRMRLMAYYMSVAESSGELRSRIRCERCTCPSFCRR